MTGPAILPRQMATDRGSPARPGVGGRTAGPRCQGPAHTVAIALLVGALACLAHGQQAWAGHNAVASEDWHRVKCTRYKQAWSAALARVGTRGLSNDFVARHEAFLASGCSRPSDVCPRSPEEFKLANIMVILSMNLGAASTFAPFSCR